MELNISDAQQQVGEQQHQQNHHQQQQQQHNQQPPYTIPGILHYLQYEWHRFEVERQEWEVEKAELLARIALLDGEKKSHENLKHDLIRRIKMLEYCLRMERAKYHKLKHGTDPPPIENLNINQATDDPDKSSNDDSASNSNNNSSTVTYGRELLRHYLQEIGYTDTIIDLRSNRVRSLLGIVDSQNSNSLQQQHIQPQPLQQNNKSNESNSTSSNDQKILLATRANKNANTEVNKKTPFPAALNPNNTEPKQPGNVSDAEASVLATFGFLYDHESIRDPTKLDEEEDEISEDAVDAADRAASTSTSEYSYFDKECNEVKAMGRQKLDMFNNGNVTNQTTLSTTGNIGQSDSRQKDVGSSNRKFASYNNENWCPSPQKTDAVDIGELAALTTIESDDYKKKQWTTKFRLQSHYDSVRALKFCEKDPLLVTVSDDETIKLWHLSRPPQSAGKARQPSLPPSINAISSLEGSLMDIEPIYTFRGHTSSILSVTICRQNLFSGAQNGELIMWKLINEPTKADPYASFDRSLLVCKFTGHDDAIWSVETIDSTGEAGSEIILVSASADLTLKFWSTTGENKEPLSVIRLDSSPTCLARMPLYNVHHHSFDFAVSASDGKIRLYDIATCLKNKDSNTQPKITLSSEKSRRINSIVIHPTLPYLASAGSNRDIEFWDLKSGKCTSTMVAHLDEVTSLACDPSGKYLLSASHDCSVRLWLFEEKACIQDIIPHRKKFDEGIFAVAFHPNLSHFATAGADGLAKVYM